MGASAFLFDLQAAVAADEFAACMGEVAPQCECDVSHKQKISHIIHRGDGKDDITDGTHASQSEQIEHTVTHIEAAEGVSLDFPLYFYSQTQKAYLRATPSRIDTTMAIGQTRYIEVTLVNDGKGDSGAVSISVPDVNWLKIVSGASIDNLASGESATITLAISPTAEDGLTLNSPLSGGRMAVNCALHMILTAKR